MTREQLLDAIIEGSKDLEDGETGIDQCIALYCEQLAQDASRKAFRDGALEAGIPRAVVDGERKLTQSEMVRGAGISPHFRSELISEMVNAGELIRKGGDYFEDMGGHILHESNLDSYIEEFVKGDKS